MTSITGLENAPVFCPIVDDYYCGMAVTVPLFSANIHGYSIDDLRNIYREKYSPTSEGVSYAMYVRTRFHPADLSAQMRLPAVT